MKELNKTTILLTVAIIGALVAGSIYAFFFVSMKNKTTAVVDLSAQLTQLSGEQTRYRSTTSQLQSDSQKIEKLSSYFIKESEIVAFTKKIEALGANAGVALSIESLDPGVTTTGAPFLGFRILAEGRFENIERLLGLLQNFPGKFEWKTVRFVREGEIVSPDGKTIATTGAPKWRAEVSLAALNFVKE